MNKKEREMIPKWGFAFTPSVERRCWKCYRSQFWIPLKMPLRLGLESAGAARFWNNPSWKHLAISSNCNSVGVRAEDLSGLIFRSLVSAHYERDRTGCQQVREPEKWGLQTSSPAEQDGEGWAQVGEMPGKYSGHPDSGKVLCQQPPLYNVYV